MDDVAELPDRSGTGTISFRKRVYRQLDPQAWDGRRLSPVNTFLVVVISIAVLFAVLQTEKSIYVKWKLAFEITEWGLGLIFVTEYLVRVWVAGENPKYQGVLGRARYVFTVSALIDLVVILSVLFTLGLGNSSLLRLFRLFRILALAKLGRFSSALGNVTDALFERRYELFMAVIAAFLVMLFASTAMYLTEGHHNPDSFGSIPRAMWWGVATMTKVGYGGAFPETYVGKIFAALFAFAAVGVVALPTGIIAAALGSVFRKETPSE